MAKHEFQTEVNQLLKLMVHSLYSHKEIFLRELISNSSDALDKLKHLTLTNSTYKGLSFDPRIDITFDEDKKLLIIEDNGIGMNEGDLVEHLGTIAKSGTKAFMENMTGDNKKDSQLIGQFGVGFYSCFMVAKKVEVLSRKASEDKANIWSSSGEGDYEIKPSTRKSYGTTITLHLKDSEKEFLESFKVTQIVEKYSNHIPFPIFMQKQHQKAAEKEGDAPIVEIKTEQINKASALWTLNKSEIKKDEYNDFYKNISHDSENPILTIHNKAEGTLSYTTLFYIPSKAPMDLFRVDYAPGVKLYINRVFITDDDKELMPTYLRFLKGIIDSADLPLNISREILQKNLILEKIRKTSVKKVLTELGKMAKKDSQSYNKFYTQFGNVLKEGLYSDIENREKILDLLRFNTLNNQEMLTLASYIEQMPKEQEDIYYIIGTDKNVIKNSPILEQFKAKKYDVLLLANEIDNIVFPMVPDFKEKKLVNVTSAKLETSKDDKEKEKELDKEYKGVVKEIKDILGDVVKDVKISTRLTNSPACVIDDKDDPSFAMQQMMQQMGQSIGEKPKPILEVNPKHELITKLQESRDQNMSIDITNLLLDQAYLADGRELNNPTEFIARLNRIMAKAL